MINLSAWLRLPAVCALCNHYHRDATAVCGHCLPHLPILIHPCERCSLPLPESAFPLCGHCLKTPPAFDRVITRYAYADPLRTLLHAYKYRQKLYLRSFFTQLLLDAWPPDTQPDCIIPVPLHPARLKERGFNQAAELARTLARRLAIPLEINLCEKIINTAHQVGLDAQQRQRNLARSFLVKPTRYRHVVLLDDVMTTGSTANALAAELKDQGVKQVDVWCCMRTV